MNIKGTEIRENNQSDEEIEEGEIVDNNRTNHNANPTSDPSRQKETTASNCDIAKYKPYFGRNAIRKTARAMAKIADKLLRVGTFVEFCIVFRSAKDYNPEALALGMEHLGLKLRGSIPPIAFDDQQRLCLFTCEESHLPRLLEMLCELEEVRRAEIPGDFQTLRGYHKEEGLHEQFVTKIMLPGAFPRAEQGTSMLFIIPREIKESAAGAKKEYVIPQIAMFHGYHGTQAVSKIVYERAREEQDKLLAAVAEGTDLELPPSLGNNIMFDQQYKRVETATVVSEWRAASGERNDTESIFETMTGEGRLGTRVEKHHFVGARAPSRIAVVVQPRDQQ